MNLDEFLAMGGYARFVWPSFILTFAVIVYNVFAARRAHAEAVRQAMRRISAQGGGA